MLGVWIEPVTAQVMMTLPCAAAISIPQTRMRRRTASLVGQVPLSASSGGSKAARAACRLYYFLCSTSPVRFTALASFAASASQNFWNSDASR